MEIIKFDCEVITPMFLGGANKSDVELRPPSIKGAMRFWWRAMKGNMELKELKAKETMIFGGGGENARKAAFSIRILNTKIILSKEEIFKRHRARNPEHYRSGIDADVLRYLAFGPFNHKTGWKKSIAPGSQFKIVLNINKAEYQKEILDSINALVTFGGLGSKSRNGFGQFDILNLNEKLQVNTNGSRSDYSFFSSDSKLFVVEKTFTCWQDALIHLGDAYRISKLQFEGKKHNYSKRVFIAAPTIQARGEEVFSRKSKVHFMHVNKVSDSEYKAQILTLPYHSIDVSNLKKYISPDELKSNLLNNHLELNEQLIKNGNFTEVKI